ncbi:protein-lysine methyltransferase METTL21D-like [Pollicipes pollicipes]|uniref:protein-lysine methyltransferase METTL21D-like n=1 Tax=Pollicipes pollicipes TaxID=41117 RepID=UPI001884CE81|nr:protein-lysine methyltransferase METTL21D-like [Pollicipes pollicipes]
MASDTFTRSLDVDSSKNELTIHQSYIGDVGCVVWDAALVLSKFIDFAHAQQPVKTEPERRHGVLDSALLLIQRINTATAVELGGGTGVVGLLAASLGCNTYITDLEDLMPLIQKNIEQNNLQEKATATVLRWGEHKNISLPEADLLLVADCVYYPESLLPLLDTISALAGPSTIVLVSYEDRDSEMKQALQKTFSESLRKEFEVEEVPTDQLHPEYRAQDIHVLVARKMT